MKAGLIALAAAVALGVAGLMVHLATSQPYLGLRLTFPEREAGAIVLRSKGPSADVPKGAAITGLFGGAFGFALIPSDLAREPDAAFGPFADYQTFLDRQQQLSRLQSLSSVTLSDSDGVGHQVSPLPRRPLTSLPLSFWGELLIGVAGFLAAAVFWAGRPTEPRARYVLLFGASILMVAPLAAVYSTRELALPREVFLPLNDISFLGRLLFPASLIAILLNYPRRIGPEWAGLAVVGAFILWWVLQVFGALGPVSLARWIPAPLSALAVIALAFLHWRKGAKAEPGPI